MKSDFSGKGLSHRKKEKRMRDTEKGKGNKRNRRAC